MEEYWKDTLKGTVEYGPGCPEELIGLMRKMLHKCKRKRLSAAQILGASSPI